MGSLISDVRCPHQPACAELTFQRQVPQIDLRQAIILREDLIERERALGGGRGGWNRLVEASEELRERIGHAGAAIRILKIHARRYDISATHSLVQIDDW